MRQESVVEIEIIRRCLRYPRCDQNYQTLWLRNMHGRAQLTFDVVKNPYEYFAELWNMYSR